MTNLHSHPHTFVIQGLVGLFVFWIRNTCFLEKGTYLKKVVRFVHMGFKSRLYHFLAVQVTCASHLTSVPTVPFSLSIGIVASWVNTWMICISWRLTSLRSQVRKLSGQREGFKLVDSHFLSWQAFKEKNG